MTTYRTSTSPSKRTALVTRQGPLRALELIETVGDAEPFQIVPVRQAWGSAMSPQERMAAKVKWAERAEYIVLTREVPHEFAPYNSVIRVSETGTEDVKRDYLAHLVSDSLGDA